MTRKSAELVAAKSKRALATLGQISPVGARDVTSTFQFDPFDGCPKQVWAHRDYPSYSAAWQDIYDLPDGYQVDHVYPRSWAEVAGMKVSWIRLFPVLAEVNTGAGRSWEKLWAGYYRDNPAPAGMPELVYAEHYQILKILSEDVGTKGNYTSGGPLLNTPADSVTGQAIQERLSGGA